MLKKIKKFFQKSHVNNQRGSVMSVALIVITVMTFSLTTITQVTVNLAGATTHQLEKVNGENTGKGLITLAINEFEAYFLVSPDFEAFNLNEIPRMEADYGVFVSDVSGVAPYDTAADFGEGSDGPGGHESRMYRFAYSLPVPSNNMLVKFAYVSNGGTASAELNPFDFSIGTNETLVMNGGVYDEITLYGKEVYLANVAPFVISGSTNQLVTPYSLDNGGTFPVLTYDTTGSIVYATSLFQYCPTGDTCYNTNITADPFEIVESNFIDADGGLVDQGEPAEETIYDFFGSFDYDAFTIDYIKLLGPTDDLEVTDAMTLDTASSVIDQSNNSGVIVYNYNPQGKVTKITYPDTPYTDITDDAHINFLEANNFDNVSLFYNNPLTISYNCSFTDDESMYINGDLTIDNIDVGTLDIVGTYVVDGDLYLTGNSIDLEGTIYVFGETHFNFNDGEGMVTQGNNAGFSLLAKDNILIEEIFVSHVNATLPTEFAAFFYTEKSIYIDTVNSMLNIEGSLFARGTDDGGNQIFLDDESSIQINGIVINSYRGYISGGVPVPLTGDLNNRFNISMIPQDNYTTKFLNIPVFETLITDIDNWQVESSEFQLEPKP